MGVITQEFRNRDLKKEFLVILSKAQYKPLTAAQI